jgi:hypothetical protein
MFFNATFCADFEYAIYFLFSNPTTMIKLIEL